MPMTQVQLEAELSDCGEDLDGMDPFSAVLMVCDALDLDPLRTVAKIRMNKKLNKEEQLIDDLISSSQSNYKKSLYMLHRVIAADKVLSEGGPRP